MHLDKFNRTLIRNKPEKNINCLPISIKDLSLILDGRKILSSLNLYINSGILKMAARKTYILKLYVAGNTPNSMRALNTLREILENEFKGVYALKVIDVLKQPQLAEEDKILATPTLAKILPPPVRKIIGDLSDREKVLIGLDLLFDELTETEYSGDK